jgi:hypothetical protein
VLALMPPVHHGVVVPVIARPDQRVEIHWQSPDGTPTLIVTHTYDGDTKPQPR